MASVSVPAWVPAQVAAPASGSIEQGAVALFDRKVVTVDRRGGVTRVRRVVYRVLRTSGLRTDTLSVGYDLGTRVLYMRGWSVPASGAPYAVTDKQAVDSGVSGPVIASDQRWRTLRVPGVAVGSLVAFEWATEERDPAVDEDDWQFQDSIPRRSSQYVLELPPGWHYNASWRNHMQIAASSSGPGRWQWDIADVSPIRQEPAMPPMGAIAGRLHVGFTGPGARGKMFQSWAEMGSWYLDLARGRDEVSGEIVEAAAGVTASAPDSLAKIRSLAEFVQGRVRYVAIEFGIGGYQPHSAAAVFANLYGDCKDKATLLRAMLKSVGINAYYVLVNSRRGVVGGAASPEMVFNHIILAIQLPQDAPAAPLLSLQHDPTLGRLVYFDPTNEATAFGRLSARLQAGYGLLISGDSSHLVRLPELPIESSGIQRAGKLILDQTGMLSGEVTEIRRGDQADLEREALANVNLESERIKLVERILTGSLASYRILHAALGGAHDSNQPIEWRYTLQADRYGKPAGDLLLVRPRVLGLKASAWSSLESSRQNPVEIQSRGRDSDDFSIALPAGYAVDSVPHPVDVDYDFASYHSRVEVDGNILHYTRSSEIKQFEVAPQDVDKLLKFYRMVDDDERSVVTFVRARPAAAQ